MERDSKMRVTVCMFGEPVLISEMLAENRTVSSMEIQPDGQMPSDKTIRAGNIFFLLERELVGLASHTIFVVL